MLRGAKILFSGGPTTSKKYKYLYIILLYGWKHSSSNGISEKSKVCKSHCSKFKGTLLYHVMSYPFLDVWELVWPRQVIRCRPPSPTPSKYFEIIFFRIACPWLKNIRLALAPRKDLEAHWRLNMHIPPPYLKINSTYSSGEITVFWHNKNTIILEFEY